MTYLERLVRRARMTPAVPGAALRDPFEQTADWPVQTPLSQADATRAIPPQVAALAPPAAAPVHVASDDSGPASANVVMASPPLEPAAQLILERVVPSVDGATEPPERAAPAVRPPVLAPPEPESAAALRTVDEFMHRMGARVPTSAPEAPRLAAPEPATPAPFAQAPLRALDPPARVPPISPPAPVRPVLPRLFSSSAPPPTSAPRQDAAVRPHEPSAPPPRPSTETRGAFVVERRAGAAHERDVHGGGAPRFGLGQI